MSSQNGCCVPGGQLQPMIVLLYTPPLRQIGSQFTEWFASRNGLKNVPDAHVHVCNAASGVPYGPHELEVQLPVVVFRTETPLHVQAPLI
jgi:hypothetical protein